MIGYDTLRIHCPYSIKSITSLELDWRPNAHATLKVGGIVDDRHQDDAVSQTVPSDVLEITIDTDKGTQTLFKGDMLSVQSNSHQGVYTLELEAISGTKRLDREKKTRSFQDTGMTYEAVIKEVLSDYPGSGVIHTTGSSTLIGEPLIQYEETDWAFIQRLASHLHTIVVPDLFEANPRIYVGMPSRNTVSFQMDAHYMFQRDFQSYRQAKVDQPELTLTDFDRYQVQSGDHYLLGDPLNVEGERWIIHGVTAQLVQGQLRYTYQLGKNSGIRQGRILQSEMVGASLQGNILDVKGQRVKLHLDVDDKQDIAKAHWFPFAPPTGNMMYLMPQKGSTGTLYFPSDRGGQAIVTGCVRQNGSSCGKTSQPENRYLGTEHGSELEMTPTAMNLKSGSPAPLQISFDDASGIILTSHRKLKLEAKEDISLFTPKKIRIQTTNLIYAKKLGKQSGFTIESEFHILGDEVHAAGTERQSYPKYDDEPDTWTPEVKEEEEDEGGFSWGKLFGAVVAVVAVVVVVAVVASIAVATGGIGGAILMGAAIGALGAVAGKIGSDIANGEISSGGEYLRSALIGGAIGAVTGAIFGPFGGATTSLLPQTTSQLMREAATTMWIGGASSSIDFVATEVFINGRVPTYGEATQAFMYGTIFTGAFMAFAPVAGFIRKAFTPKKPVVIPKGVDAPDVKNLGEGTGKLEPIKEVEIVDHTGKPIGELDEIDLKNGIFYEDKAAKGLDVINPRTGLPTQTPQQFTDKQILGKTRKRIKNIAEATATRATKNGTPTVPSLDEIKGIRKFVFRLDGDTPELRRAAENSLEQLRKEFPDYSFEVLFGGEK